MDFTRFRQWCPPTRLGSFVHPGILYKAMVPGLQPVAAPIGQTPQGPDPHQTAGRAWGGSAPPTGASPEHQMAWHHMMKEYHHTSPEGNAAHAQGHGAIIQHLAGQGVQTSAQHMRDVMPHLPETVQRHFQAGLHMSLETMKALLSKAEKKIFVGMHDPETGKWHEVGTPGFEAAKKKSRKKLEEKHGGPEGLKRYREEAKAARDRPFGGVAAPKKKGRPRKKAEPPAGWGKAPKAFGRDIPAEGTKKEEPKKEEPKTKTAEATEKIKEAAPATGKRKKQPRVTKKMKQEAKRAAAAEKPAEAEPKKPAPKTKTAEATEKIKEAPKTEAKPGETGWVPRKKDPKTGAWVPVKETPKEKPKRVRGKKVLGERKLTAKETEEMTRRMQEKGKPKAEAGKLTRPPAEERAAAERKVKEAEAAAKPKAAPPRKEGFAAMQEIAEAKRGKKAEAPKTKTAAATEKLSAKRKPVKEGPPEKLSEDEHVVHAGAQIAAHYLRHATGDDKHLEKLWAHQDDLTDRGKLKLESRHFEAAEKELGVKPGYHKKISRMETGHKDFKGLEHGRLSSEDARGKWLALQAKKEAKPLGEPVPKAEREKPAKKRKTVAATEKLKEEAPKAPAAPKRKTVEAKETLDVGAPKRKRPTKAERETTAAAKKFKYSGAQEVGPGEFEEAQAAKQREAQARIGGPRSRGETIETKTELVGRLHEAGQAGKIRKERAAKKKKEAEAAERKREKGRAIRSGAMEAEEPSKAGRGYGKGKVEEVSPVAAKMERERHAAKMQKEARAKVEAKQAKERAPVTSPRSGGVGGLGPEAEQAQQKKIAQEQYQKQQMKMYEGPAAAGRGVSGAEQVKAPLRERVAGALAGAGRAAKEKVHAAAAHVMSQFHPHPSEPVAPGPKLHEKHPTTLQPMGPQPAAPTPTPTMAPQPAAPAAPAPVAPQPAAPAPAARPSFMTMPRTAVSTGGPQLAPGSMQRSLDLVSDMIKAAGYSMSSTATPKPKTPAAPAPQKVWTPRGTQVAGAAPAAPQPAAAAPALPKAGEQTVTGGPQLAAGTPARGAKVDLTAGGGAKKPGEKKPKAGKEPGPAPIGSAYGALVGLGQAVGQETGAGTAGRVLFTAAPAQVGYRMDVMSPTPMQSTGGPQLGGTGGGTSPRRTIGLGTYGTGRAPRGSQSSMQAKSLNAHPLIRGPGALRPRQ